MFWFKFILGLNFIFLLFLGVVMYDNEFETMEIYSIVGSVIERQFRQCLTKPCSKPFSILPTVTSKHCLLLIPTRRLASQTRKLFIYMYLK